VQQEVADVTDRRIYIFLVLIFFRMLCCVPKIIMVQTDVVVALCNYL